MSSVGDASTGVETQDRHARAVLVRQRAGRDQVTQAGHPLQEADVLVDAVPPPIPA